MILNDEFIYFINGYYQAVYLNKKIYSGSLTNEMEFLPELAHFREWVSQISPSFAEAILDGDNLGNSGAFEKVMISERLSQNFGAEDFIFGEIENSVNLCVKRSLDISIYRIQFQLSTKALMEQVNDFLLLANQQIPKKKLILRHVNSLLNEHDIAWPDVRLVRTFKNMGYSDRWIFEYAVKALTPP